MKKIVSLLLVLVLMISICATGLAEGKSLAPGKNIGSRVWDITSSPTFRVTAAGRSGDKIKVQLDLWDLTVTKTDKYKKAFVGTFSISSGCIYLNIRPTLMPFVSGRTTRARLRIWALSSNNDWVDVTYNKQ